jgi:hypothetical protein
LHSIHSHFLSTDATVLATTSRAGDTRDIQPRRQVGFRWNVGTPQPELSKFLKPLQLLKSPKLHLSLNFPQLPNRRYPLVPTIFNVDSERVDLNPYQSLLQTRSRVEPHILYHDILYRDINNWQRILAKYDISRSRYPFYKYRLRSGAGQIVWLLECSSKPMASRRR